MASFVCVVYKNCLIQFLKVHRFMNLENSFKQLATSSSFVGVQSRMVVMCCISDLPCDSRTLYTYMFCCLGYLVAGANRVIGYFKPL